MTSETVQSASFSSVMAQVASRVRSWGCRGQDVFVRDLLWDDVKIWFDLEANGTLPDVQVPNTTIDD